MKKFVISFLLLVSILIPYMTLCVDPIVANELNPKLPNGNYENDNFPMRFANGKTNVFFQTSELGLCKMVVFSKTCHINTATNNLILVCKIKVPARLDEYVANDWRIIFLILGNDNIWHIVPRKVGKIAPSKLHPQELLISAYGQPLSKKDLWGRRFEDIYLKPVNYYTVFKTCILYKGRVASKFIYSKEAERFFMTRANNVIDSDIMGNEFNIEQ